MNNYWYSTLCVCVCVCVCACACVCVCVREREREGERELGAVVASGLVCWVSKMFVFKLGERVSQLLLL